MFLVTLPPHLTVGINHGTNGLVVEVVDVHPLYSLIAVLFLLSLQHQLNKKLLQFFIAVVDAELFKAIGNKDRKDIWLEQKGKEHR